MFAYIVQYLRGGIFLYFFFGGGGGGGLLSEVCITCTHHVSVIASHELSDISQQRFLDCV